MPRPPAWGVSPGEPLKHQYSASISPLSCMDIYTVCQVCTPEMSDQSPAQLPPLDLFTVWLGKWVPRCMLVKGLDSCCSCHAQGLASALVCAESANGLGTIRQLHERLHTLGDPQRGKASRQQLSDGALWYVAGGGLHDCEDHTKDMGPLCHCEGQGSHQAAVSKCARPSGTPTTSRVTSTMSRICCRPASIGVNHLNGMY